MATERSSPARRPGASKTPAFADAPVNPQTDSPFAPASNPATPAIPTVAPMPARPVTAAVAPPAPPVAAPPVTAPPTTPPPTTPPLAAPGAPTLPPPMAPPANGGLIPPPLPVSPSVPTGMAPPLPLTEQPAAGAPAAAPPAAPAPPATGKKKRGRRGGQRDAVAPAPQAVDPALLAAYRQFSEDVRPSDADGVYFPERPSEEPVAEAPKGRGRRTHEDLMPRGKGRAPTTGKGPIMVAGVAAIGVGTAVAVVLSGHHGTAAAPPVASHAVRVDATALNTASSITVPTGATRGAAYTLKVPAGFVGDAGNDSGSDVLLSEPVLDLHLRVQSRTKGSGAAIPNGTPLSIGIANATAKGSETTMHDHAVRTVRFVRAGVTYTVTETVPAAGKAHTFKVLDDILGGWTFQG